ncbi:MAG TPA: HD-GYP domain-containing protein [Solirubrobacter sp.]|nr:HD-GYP domain-containing protein [Solirubrobacter sp.]
MPRSRFIAAAALLVLACAATAALVSPAAALLLAIAAGGEVFTVQLRGMRISGSLAALVLAMALLGPVPAAAIAVAAALFDAAVTRGSVRSAALNGAMFGLLALGGGALLERFEPSRLIAFGAAIVCVFLLSSALNFLAVAAGTRALRLREAFATVYRTLLPFDLATALLTAGVAVTYEAIGISAIALLAVVLLVFHQLANTAVKAFDRGRELMRRTEELGALQVGLLATVLQTLSMRDAMTARHSAAVARYAREVAAMMGLDEREQELIHTAALLHDIGKFILPDSVLFADRRLDDDEWALVKLHPSQGAELVSRIEGYGPVAEIVLHHHERFEGGGYPTGIAGEAIPLGARIIAVADTYDVMTSRDSYRRPVSQEAALAEIRRVSGTQLDPAVAEVFARMIVEGRVRFSHSDEADFEFELDRRSIKARGVRADHPIELPAYAPRGNAAVQRR